MQDLANQVITSILSLTAPTPPSDNEHITTADIIKAPRKLSKEEPCGRINYNTSTHCYRFIRMPFMFYFI